MATCPTCSHSGIQDAEECPGSRQPPAADGQRGGPESRGARGLCRACRHDYKVSANGNVYKHRAR